MAEGLISQLTPVQSQPRPARVDLSSYRYPLPTFYKVFGFFG